MVSFPTRHWALFEHSGGHLLSAVVQAVVAQKEACIDGLGQQGIDGNHDEEHGQLEDRVESEENRTGHHGQHPREDEVLETEKGAGQIQQECGLVTLLVIDSSRSPYMDVCWASISIWRSQAILKFNRSQVEFIISLPLRESISR